MPGVRVLPHRRPHARLAGVLIGGDRPGGRAGDPTDRAVFWGDLIPTRWQVPVRWTSAYDDYPIEAIEVRNELLARAATEGWWSYFTHDPGEMPVRIEATDRGYVAAVEPLRHGMAVRRLARRGIMGRPLPTPSHVNTTSKGRSSRMNLSLSRCAAALLSAPRLSSSSPSPRAQRRRRRQRAGGGNGGGGDGDRQPRRREITADNLEFDATTIEAAAGEEFTITFVNDDSAPHNVASTPRRAATRSSRASDHRGRQTRPPSTSPALEPGTYYFQCDVHPDMNGTIVVEG